MLANYKPSACIISLTFHYCLVQEALFYAHLQIRNIGSESLSKLPKVSQLLRRQS